MTIDTIHNDVVVTLEYKMIVDGQIIEEADAENPLFYLHGSDNIVPGLQNALDGKKVGDTLIVEVQPADAFGDYDEDEIDEAELTDFDLPEGVAEGDEVEIEDDDGNLYIATIVEIRPDKIRLDFNAPYAGKVVTFDVKILAIREANPEEIEEGEPEEYAIIFGDHEHDHDGHNHNH